jgi:hypothetical protein
MNSVDKQPFWGTFRESSTSTSSTNIYVDGFKRFLLFVSIMSVQCIDDHRRSRDLINGDVGSVQIIL